MIPSELKITVEGGIEFSNDTFATYPIATVTGGVPPYTFTSNKALVSGLEINGSRMINGGPLVDQTGIFVISGMISGLGADMGFYLTFTVTDAVNSTVISEPVLVQLYVTIPPVVPPK